MSSFWRRYSRSSTALIGVGLLSFVIVCAIIGPVVWPGDPWAIVGEPFLWPGSNSRFPLGTDVLGRDVLSGLLHGARMSLLIGILATFGASFLGTVVGLVAGYYRGWLDGAVMRFSEVFQAIPAFLMALIIVDLFSPSLTTIVAAIITVSWPSFARLVRAETMRIRGQDYISACVTFGMSDARILATQILPNCLPPLIVTTSLMVASAILIEAGLSFLGLGDPSRLSWGTMIATGREALRSAWYMSALPGFAILVTVVGINLAGDGLNEALSPARGGG